MATAEPARIEIQVTDSQTLQMKGLQNLTTYYRSYWNWTGPKNIRAWELRRARVAIWCAGMIYRLERKRIAR